MSNTPNNNVSNILFHSSRPLNDNESGFGEFDTLDFEIQDNGRKLMMNSLYIEGDIEVFSTGSTALALLDKIGVNNNIGYHSLFESWSVEAGGQNVQNLNYYPRYVNVVNTASNNQMSVLTPSAQAEGQQLTEEAGRYVLQAVNAYHDTGDAANPQVSRTAQFCVKPKICLNNMFGDSYSFQKKGSIRLSCNLARNGSFLMGPGVSTTSSYVIKNVRVKYITKADDGKQGEIIMNSVVGTKQTMSSSTANLSVKVPAKAVTGVVMTYISQSHETSVQEDSHRLENLPKLDEVVYLFSDSQSKYISYNITDKDNMLDLGVQALSASGVSCKVNAFKNSGNQAVIHGLNFQDTVDLSQQKFSVNLSSSSTKIATDPRNVYLHFLTIISM